MPFPVTFFYTSNGLCPILTHAPIPDTLHNQPAVYTVVPIGGRNSWFGSALLISFRISHRSCTVPYVLTYAVCCFDFFPLGLLPRVLTPHNSLVPVVVPAFSLCLTIYSCILLIKVVCCWYPLICACSSSCILIPLVASLTAASFPIQSFLANLSLYFALLSDVLCSI